MREKTNTYKTIILQSKCYYSSNYLKVNVAIFIHIECTKNMVTELFRISRWEKHFIHVNEFSRSQTAVGTVLLHER